MWENAAVEVLGQIPLQTQQGIQNFTDAKAKAMRAEDLDRHRRDLWESDAVLRRRGHDGGRRHRIDAATRWAYGPRLRACV